MWGNRRDGKKFKKWENWKKWNICGKMGIEGKWRKSRMRKWSHEYKVNMRKIGEMENLSENGNRGKIEKSENGEIGEWVNGGRKRKSKWTKWKKCEE